MPTFPGVYAIVNQTSWKCYVGSARRINTRWTSHRHLLRRGGHFSPQLQAAWNKYGKDQFSFVVVEACPVDRLITTEQRWFELLAPEYNNCTTAKSAALDPTVVEKIRAASIARGRVFQVGGELLGVSDIRQRYGVSHGVFYSRLQRGWDTTTAATTAPDSKHTARGARVHEYVGQFYTLAELVPLAKCSKTALFRRIKAGMSVQEAVEMTPEQAEQRRVGLIRRAHE